MFRREVGKPCPLLYQSEEDQKKFMYRKFKEGFNANETVKKMNEEFEKWNDGLGLEGENQARLWKLKAVKKWYKKFKNGVMEW
ncbi:hypothetical protein B9Z55_027066 [Caenorhabditis nigoni]|uniref:Uncharacterized protein n=1 Tax=Caenorhabditis nigoni TaxID=1611254 RepID=A0A2G5SJ79_9PELO|nr:hypothetical protein B9Z55_027066 [Caenorhabditis nigoni]